MNIKVIFMSILISSVAAVSCNNNNNSQTSSSGKDSLTVSGASIKEEPVSYTLNGKTFKGYIAYDSAKKDKRPGVLNKLIYEIG